MLLLELRLLLRLDVGSITGNNMLRFSGNAFWTALVVYSCMIQLLVLPF